MECVYNLRQVNKLQVLSFAGNSTSVLLHHTHLMV